MDNTQLDLSIIALTKAIGHQESGGKYDLIGDNGHSMGAYQWNNPTPLKKGEIPKNFKGFASDVGADPNDFSSENQDRVAYKTVERWGKEGLNPAQIASRWNSGHPDAYKTAKPGFNKEQGVAYDVKSYVDNVAKYYKQYSGTTDKIDTSLTQDKIIPDTSTENTPDTSLKAGAGATGFENVANTLAGITGGKELAQGLGYTLNNAFGGNKLFDDTMKGLQDTQSKLLKHYKELRDQGKDTSHALKGLQSITQIMQDYAGKAGDILTGGISNKDVLKSAGQLSTLPALAYGSSALKAGTLMPSAGKSFQVAKTIPKILNAPAIETAMSKFNMPLSEFQALSDGEKFNAIAEATKTANAADKIVLQQVMEKLAPQAIKEAGGSVAFAQLHPNLAKAGGLIGKLLRGGMGVVGAGLAGAEINNIYNKLTK